jgi:hypothetical protein
LENANQNSVVIKLSKDAGIKKEENLYVYVVDQSGKILEKTPFKDLQASLKSTKNDLMGQNKLYIAQAIPKQLSGKTNERVLLQAGAYQVVKSLVGNSITVNSIPGKVLKPWIPGNCLITGNISNTITLDGNEVTVPVCNARVHLMEVETEFLFHKFPLIYRWIPDWVIVEISKRINEILKDSPVPDPVGPISVSGKINIPLQSLNMKSSLQRTLKMRALPQLPQDIINGIKSSSLDTIRQTFADNHLLLHPYICLWPIFWPWLYECDEDNIAYTDSNGHFEYWENTTTEDGPLNIYTWVEVQINGQWVTVYNPAIPCNTLWNYSCGSPININLNDSRIPPCVSVPIQGDIVWVKRIGNGTSIRNLSMSPADPSKPSLFADARGLTNSVGLEGGKYVSPFSGSFPLYIQFGDGFPSAAVSHFRWKYHRITDADLQDVNEPFILQEGPLAKSYTYQVKDNQGNDVFFSGNFKLDEDVKVNDITIKIYKIPHVDASIDTGIATAEWNQDTVSINVDALSLQNGLYEFVLELCDSTGKVINNFGNNVFQVDSFLPSPPNPASVSANNVDHNYVVWNGIQEAGFRFLIRIDNDPTTCSIYNAQILNYDGTIVSSDTQCGFAQYKPPKTGDTVLLHFTARQPHRFGMFSYYVNRGNSGNVYSNVSQVPEPINFRYAQGIWISYQYDPLLSDLLGGCDKAAFAETLDVYAYHTDGTNRIGNYDSDAVAAFAVEPES